MMIELGPARESEVILAFLKAEADSPRFAQSMLQRLGQLGFSRDELIEGANLEDARQNGARCTILQQYRGYGANAYLFLEFPNDVRWRRVELEPREHGRLMYAREEHWVRMSDHTRRPARLIEKMTRGEIPDDPASHIRSIQQGLSAGKRYAELIAAAGGNGELILIEGHCRATAYVALEHKENIKVFLASSPLMHRWAFY